MIKILKKKFVLTSMTAVTILLIGLFIAQNVLTFISMDHQSERLLHALDQIYTPSPAPEESGNPDDGRADMPEDQPAPSGGNSNGESAGESDENRTDDRGPAQSSGEEPEPGGLITETSPRINFELFRYNVNENDIMRAVYYLAVIDENGEILQLDLSRIASVTEEEASARTLELYNAGKKNGWKDNFKFTSVTDIDGNTVYIFLDRQRELDNIRNMLIYSFLIILVCFSILLILVMVMANRTIKPIAQNMERQKSFVTDAGHEIKTPLAIIQANTEALELHNGENKWTANIKSQIMRLNVLMTNMLTLAKAEEGSSQETISEIDLSQLLKDILKMFHESAENKKLRIVSDLENNLKIKAGRTQIGQVLSIIFDNAVKYSSPGSDIRIHLYAQEKWVVLETENVTDLMPECEPERLFDRFYRPDASRYSEESGNGIGLSAARAIMELYSGSIHCSYKDGRIILFTLQFKKTSERK